MGEVERRRGYGWNRVLIESARILDPQFKDAVVFLSGAQIEMLRNVTQYLNRLGTYAAEYNPGYYLVPTDEDFDDILEIVADLEETLMGNPNTIWGYYERWSWWGSTLRDGSSPTSVLTVAVPSGFAYRLEHWQAYHHGGQPCSLNLIMQGDPSDELIYTANLLAHAESAYQSANMTMEEDDQLALHVYSLPVDTRAYLHVWGYKMRVPE